MRRLILTTTILFILPIFSAQAQTSFWNYDDNNRETLIPAQCDGQFDEAHGGVFMPTPEELYEQGELFLLEKGENRSNAGYCLLSAAIQGNVKAQYRVAQLYNKGLILPQNDIVAYRWAFLASLNGSKEAEQLALTLEQILSADEIKLATETIETMLPTITEQKNADLQEQENLLAEKKATLEEINKEIDKILGVNFVPPEIKLPQTEDDQEANSEQTTQQNKKAAPQQRTSRTSSQKIFKENDRLKK